MSLISEINEGLKSEPVFYSKYNIKNYQNVTVTGHFDFKKQIYLYSLNDKGVPGFDIITPLQTNTNEILMVNRGWIKNELRNDKNINNLNTKNYSGVIKKITKSNPFKPKNDLKNNIWYTLNVDDLQNYTGLKLIDYVLYIQDEYNELIKPKIISPDLPNNHLKYAITWYSVALSILLYFLYFRKKQ